MDQSNQTNMTGIVIVSPNADITLVVGPSKMQIKVQSAFLKETSKPFAAMLSETWKDPEVKTISLPEDDAEAMLEICIALHHQYAKLSRGLSPVTMLELAIIADTYLLLDTLSCVASRYWLSAAGRLRDLFEHHGVLGMLQCATAFWNYTYTLICDSNDSYIIGEGTKLDIFMDQALPVALEERRSKIKLGICRKPLGMLPAPNPRCEQNCGFSAEYRLSCLYVTQSETLNLLPHMDISSMLKILNDLPSRLHPSLGVKCSTKKCEGLHDWEAWRLEIVNRIIESMERWGGLCLFCCKLGIWTQCCSHLRTRPRGERKYFLQAPDPQG